MMKTPKNFIALLTGATLLAGSAFAGTAPAAVATDPVGYVTFTLPESSDLKVGLPLQSGKSFSGAVSSVTAGDVVVGATVPDLTTDVHFLLVTSDNGLQGNWYTITGATGSTISVAEDLAAAGLTSADTVCAVKFWTLDTLFPSGGAIPQSPDPFSPVAQVLLNDVNSVGINLTPTAAYVYYDGVAGGDAGWLDAANPGDGYKGSTLINPETFLIIRNSSGPSAKIVMSGGVPTGPVASSVLSRSAGAQDSLVFNPFPSAISLGASELISSGAIRQSPDPFSPLDVLLLFDSDSTGLNNTPVASYLYYDGVAGGDAGWLDAADPGAGYQEAITIPAGAPMLIRRAVGADELITWAPAVPYSL